MHDRFTIDALAAALDRRETLSVDLVGEAIDRIDAIDAGEDGLHAMVELNPDAMQIAAALDIERASQGARSILHGIPIALKDNIDTDDRMQTTAGSLALLTSRASTDAAVVTRLREAGAVLLGKANLSEWANFRGQGSVSGWSARGGQTRNAVAPARSPGGSSAGSAVAVAAGIVCAAIGTETSGSIVIPASFNGIVGLKPTIGLVSQAGIIPIAATMDTAGPMTRNVRDAAQLLSLIADDPAISDAPPRTMAQSRAPFGRSPERDYVSSLDATCLRGARLGIVRAWAGFHAPTDSVFEQALQRLREAGAELVDPVEPVMATTLRQPMRLLMRYEFKDGINRYLRTRVGDGPRSLADLIAFNDAHRDIEMRLFGQSLFIEAQAFGPLSEPEYQQAREAATGSARHTLNEVIDQHRLDALIGPTLGPAGLIDPILGDHYVGGGGSIPLAAVAGYPHLTVPMGTVVGLPVGLSWVGPAFSEARLLSLAYAFEQHATV